jgi:signal transduction histidine kinase
MSQAEGPSLTSPALLIRGRRLGMAAAAVPILLGLCGLLGWSVDSRHLTSIQPDLVPINPLTAICMILGGASMLILYRGRDGIGGRRLARAMAAAILIAGGIRLMGFYSPLDIPLDRILFRDRLVDVPFGPNHMAPNTAFAFLFLGGAIFAIARGDAKGRHASQGLGIVLAAYAFFSLLGYLFHFVSLYRVAAHIPMAVPTILGFLTASIGVLCVDPRSGPMALLFSGTTGGSMARRLLPVVVFVPTGAAWLRLQTQTGGYGDLIAYITQLTLANVIIASIAVYLASKRLDGEDLKRRRAEEEIRRLNLSLKRQTEELKTANQGLEAFSYSVSHDLRAPLRHVSGYVEMLKHGLAGKLEGKSVHFMDVIVEAVKRMTSLIDDLLEFAKLERTQVRLARIDMDALARDCIRRVEPDAEGRKIDWVVGALPDVEGDRSLLEQVLVNLLSNALKYSRKTPETRVEIGFLRGKDGNGGDGGDGGDDGEAGDRRLGTFFVRDNGVGFDMKYADKLFGVFQRMHKESDYEGTGIGLANVRSIVQKHGGRAWAEAEAGRGAMFHFTLRLHPGTGGV